MPSWIHFAAIHWSPNASAQRGPARSDPIPSHPIPSHPIPSPHIMFKVITPGSGFEPNKVTKFKSLNAARKHFNKTVSAQATLIGPDGSILDHRIV